VPDSAPRIRTILVDDEEIARSTLRTLLASDREFEIVAECANGLEAVEAARALAPDLVFLDVQMPGLGGLEVLERLDPDRMPLVIFATAYDRYALEAFDRCAVDYLLKPFDDDRFFRAVERANARLRTEAAAEIGRRNAELRATVQNRGDAAAPLRRLAIQHGTRIEYVDAHEIEWIEAADQYVQIHARGGVHLVRESMDRLERMLDPAAFLRVHRSAIVALAAVRTFETLESGNGQVVLRSGERLPVSRSRAPEIRARLA
jgi:two-component system LytT family response regulator